MSVGSIINPTTGKLYDDLYDHGGGVAQNLNQVLTVGNSAGNQSATDFNDIGCVSIETGKVYQGNQLSLQIGEAGDTLQIKGATAKGSLLVGNGVNTEELPVGADGLFLKANSGASNGVEWASVAGGGVATLTAGTNISLTGTATDPIVNVSNPIVLTNGGNTTSYQATGITKSVGTTSLTIAHTVANGAVAITSTASGGTISETAYGNINITSSTGNVNLQATASKVRIYQDEGNTTTKLTTTVANKNFYPDFLITNNNLNAQDIPQSSIQGERLTLENRGVSPSSGWIEYGTENIASAGFCSCIHYDSTTGYIWCASNDTLYVLDDAFTSILATHSFSGSSAGSGTNIKVIFQYGNFVFVGGDFANVAGTDQYGITRFDKSTFAPDPIYDGANLNVDGVNGYVNCICGDPYNPNDSIFVGGSFASLHEVGGGSSYPTGNLIRITGVSASGGYYQDYAIWKDELSTDSEVYCATEATGTGYCFFGGAFTQTRVLTGASQSVYYIGRWESSSQSWTDCDSNTFNNYVYSCATDPNGQILVGGSFTHQTPNFLLYIDPNNTTSITTSSISPNPINSINSITHFNSYGMLSLIDSSTQVWTSNTTNSFTDWGISLTGNAPSGVQYWNGVVKATFFNQSYPYYPTTLPQYCVFTLSSGGEFLYNGSPYTSFQITNPDIIYEFRGDGNGKWRLVGSVGSFGIFA